MLRVRSRVLLRFAAAGILMLAAANSASGGGITGPFGYSPSGTQDWWDPIVGGNFSQPLGRNFSFNLRGDIGGFGVGSELTWQLLPSLSWQFADWGSIEAGYRWVYADYESGSGPNLFKYDMLNQGFQVGLTFHF